MDIVAWLGENWIALVSALIAIGSLVVGICALVKAGKANDYADRAEQRETEINHVSFDFETNFEASTVTIYNTASGRTLGLRGSVTVNDEERPVSDKDLDAEGRMTLHFPSIRAEYQQHLVNVRNQEHSPNPSMPPYMDSYLVAWDLVWHTPQRNPDASVKTHNMVSFPDE
jgi:hypothetical protein